MSTDPAAWLHALTEALSRELSETPPTPIPSPPGGGEALHHQPFAPRPGGQNLPPPPWGRDGEGGPELGLAVSGGGDSLAMLHLCQRAGIPLRAVTVDHGLRPEAAAEAARVAEICAGLGLPHDTLRWHWDGAGNLQDAARRGRRALIVAWAQGHGLTAVALAHTQDDVAETFLMRLARGAGVDGLSAMAATWHEGGITWLRPLLTTPRATLRAWLATRGLAWTDDPSNDNPRFDRVKARRALAALAPLGLTAPRLADVAAHLAEARQALDHATQAAWTRCLSDHGLALRLDPAALQAEPAEIRRRLVQRLLLHIAPADYAARGGEVARLLPFLLAGQGGTLAGCRFQRLASGLWAYREARAVQGLACGQGPAWDGRWRIDGPWPQGAEIRALGADGLAQCPDWRAKGLPRGAQLSAPALWQGARLIAAPSAGFGPDAFRLLPQFPSGHRIIP